MAITAASKGTEQRTDWATPWEIFRLIEKRYEKFTLDACASAENAKVPENYFTEEQDGLKQSWAGQRVFYNPPYGREVPFWTLKAVQESHRGCPFSLGLCVPRTDAAWWHDHASLASEICFLKGRIAFEDPTGNKRSSPQDASHLIIFHEGHTGPPKVTFWDWKKEITLR